MSPLDPTCLPPGQAVRRRRQQLGIRQGELARHLGLSPSFVALLEAGRSPVPLDKVSPLGRLLQLPEVWLWERALAPRATGEGARFHAWLFGPGGRLRQRYLADLAQARQSLAPEKT